MGESLGGQAEQQMLDKCDETISRNRQKKYTQITLQLHVENTDVSMVPYFNIIPRKLI